MTSTSPKVMAIEKPKLKSKTAWGIRQEARASLLSQMNHKKEEARVAVTQLIDEGESMFFIFKHIIQIFFYINLSFI